MSLGTLTLGFLGAGNMGSAIARAVVRSADPDSHLPARQLVIYDPREASARALSQELGAHLAASPQEVAERADLVVLACKPQDAKKALHEAGRGWGADKLLISIAAGLTVEDVGGWLGDGWSQGHPLAPRGVPQVARVMPNVAAQVGAGVTAVLRMADGTHQARLEALFRACGEVVVLDKEGLFDAVTALSGSGPAYLFVAMEALADGGVKMGLPRDVAMTLAVQTVYGAARLAMTSGEHPAQLKDKVASPGGTTIHGLAELERAGFRGALIQAVEAATLRGAQLSGGGRG
jgi:pyrroline-5-carboxylate reductase